jgi:hypothetical protein
VATDEKDVIKLTVQTVALAQALSLTGQGLNAAHQFVDLLTSDATETVLEPKDAELAEIVHTAIIEVEQGVAKLAAELAEAIKVIEESTPEDGSDTTDDGYGLYL